MSNAKRNTLIASFAVVAMVAVVVLWLQRRPAALPMPRDAAEPMVVAVEPPMPPASAIVDRSRPPAEPAPVSEPITSPGIEASLVTLLGRKVVLSMLQLDDFPRRFVATVDNLGRAYAPASVWPVNPTGGRIQVIERERHTIVDPDNGLRYAPFVLLIESVDAKELVDWYVRMLPLLQAAYEDIGFLGRRFHARLLDVVDQLLSTPDVPEPLVVTLTEVHGPVASQRPWLRYEFADPELEHASAGQKIMLRVGPVNQRRLKARLQMLRRELAGRTAAR